MTKTPTLPPKQLLFVQAYLIDPNATKAYQKAYGGKASVAAVCGAKLLRNAKVAASVAAGQAKVAEKSGVTAERVLEELSRIAFSDMRQFAKWGSAGVQLNDSADLSDDEARCVSEVSETVTKEGGTIKFKLHDKVAALTLLGKHLGLFPDRVVLEDPAHQTDEQLMAQRVLLRRKLNLGA